MKSKRNGLSLIFIICIIFLTLSDLIVSRLISRVTAKDANKNTKVYLKKEREMGGTIVYQNSLELGIGLVIFPYYPNKLKCQTYNPKTLK